jgi:formylmethanofuran dehydrogenase subunit E
MLGEAGAFDIAKLQSRIDAEIEKLRPKPRAAASTVVEAHPTKPKPLDTPVTCARCGKTVPSSRTTITAAGTMCDTCAP